MTFTSCFLSVVSPSVCLHALHLSSHLRWFYLLSKGATSLLLCCFTSSSFIVLAPELHSCILSRLFIDSGFVTFSIIFIKCICSRCFVCNIELLCPLLLAFYSVCSASYTVQPHQMNLSFRTQFKIKIRQKKALVWICLTATATLKCFGELCDGGRLSQSTWKPQPMHTDYRSWSSQWGASQRAAGSTKEGGRGFILVQNIERPNMRVQVLWCMYMQICRMCEEVTIEQQEKKKNNFGLSVVCRSLSHCWEIVPDLCGCVPRFSAYVIAFPHKWFLFQLI